MNILFVCTGNTCRSPMAEGIFKYLIKNEHIDNVNISSAGISAYEGQKANEKAIEVLNSLGIDITNHKSRQLNNSIIDNSDLILTMTNSHKMSILKYAPKVSEKVFTLKEFVNTFNEEIIDFRNFDIDDPFGMDYSGYYRSMEEIKSELKKIIVNINKIAIDKQ
ncbi:MAG: low molecular weight protein arginine phosphatase [Sedimentibacter sp.]